MVSPQISHPLDSCPYSSATPSAKLQAVNAQEVAPALSHIDAFRSWGTKHYTMKGCPITVGQLIHPKVGYPPSKGLVLRPGPQFPGHSKYAFKPSHKRNAFVRAIAAGPLSSDGARQERAEALARMEKRSEGTGACESEPTLGVGSVARSDKQVKQCSICEYSKPLEDFVKTVSSKDERTEACRACMAVLRAMRPGSRIFPLWHLKLTPKEAWERAKSCKNCGLVKELRDFARDAKCKDEIGHHCRSCVSRNSGAQPTRVPLDTPQQCSRCNEVKPASEYHINKKRPTGLHSMCKPCKSEYQRVRSVSWKASEKVPRHQKVCTACGQTKTVSEFHKRRISSDGFSYHCKSCKGAYYKQSPRSKYIADDASPRE
jgi:hypothetical protein